MSFLSAFLLTPALNPSHPSSYHRLLLLTFSAILILITQPGRPIRQRFIWLAPLLLFSTIQNITPYYIAPLETALSPDLSLFPAPIASKCRWQTLPDLGSDHLPISITIPTSPLINSISHPPLFNFNKARLDKYFFYIDTHCPPSSCTIFSQKPPIPSPNSSMVLPLLPFPSATSIALPKPGGFLKLQAPLRNAERHFSSLSDLPNFPSCHTPVDCANQLSAHLQSHFSTQTPNPKTLSKYWKSTHK